VDPGDQQYRELQTALPRIGHEVFVQLRRVIAVVGAVERVGDAGPQHVIDEEERNRESENELDRLGGRHLERTAQPQRKQRQAVVRRKGAVEDDAAGRTPPKLVDALEDAIHYIDRDEAQAVVEEMGRHI
jgi:hypothetical protein